MHLKDLKQKTPAQLVAQAEEMGIEGASTLRKQDLLFSILKVRAESGAEIMGSGTIEVLNDGSISGKGAAWDVTGKWSWENGYLCRSLYWGEDDLGYSCQMVEGRGDELRFTSDRGTGRSASLRLRP